MTRPDTPSSSSSSSSSDDIENWMDLMPTIILHPEEEFFPVSIEHMLRFCMITKTWNDRLCFLPEQFATAIEQKPLTLETLEQKTSHDEAWRDLSQATLRVVDHKALSQYAYFQEAPVYVRVSQKTRTSLQLQCTVLMTGKRNRSRTCVFWRKFDHEVQWIHPVSFVLCYRKIDDQWTLKALLQDRQPIVWAPDNMQKNSDFQVFLRRNSHDRFSIKTTSNSSNKEWRPSVVRLPENSTPKWCQLKNFLSISN